MAGTSEHSLNRTDQTTLLGQDVVVTLSQVPKKQRDKVASAKDSARRIQSLRLRPDVDNQVD